MSFEATQAVWKHSKQRRAAFLLLLTIADYVNEKEGGAAWPGVPRLAASARMSERQVQRITRVLENSGELQVTRHQGPHGTNLYKVCLPKNVVVPVAGDTSDNRGAVLVTPETCIGANDVTQSVNEPLFERTPVVPTGDLDFWIQKCFDCFRQSPRPLAKHVLQAVLRAIPFLEKKGAPSLVLFYQDEPMDSNKKPFNSRKHLPERLLLHLPEQLALAVQAFPPSPPKKEEPPRWREFFLWKNPECYLPKSFDVLPYDLQGEYQREYKHFLAETGETGAK